VIVTATSMISPGVVVCGALHHALGGWRNS